MKIVVTHPFGNQNLRAVIASFEENGLLAEFITTLAVNRNSYLVNLLPERFRKELLRRCYPVSMDRVSTRPLLEISRNVLPKLGFRSSVAHETGFASVDRICTDLDSFTASGLQQLKDKHQLDAVYAYEDSALNVFTEARKLGVACIYDLPIGYWKAARKLLKAEQERWPEWADTITAFKDSDKKLLRKDGELELADRIFVASSFTARTLNDFPGVLAPVEVIPYGFPPVAGNRTYSPADAGPLKLLYVGGLSQRKGIAYLFEAVKNIGTKVSLTVVGQKTNAACAPLDEALLVHKWVPSLPHAEVLELMRQHDVLVFPSLFEGFGLVITEAMSQGTPVITTDRTAGPDLITHGQNGWIVEAGSTAALQAQIELLVDQPETVAVIGKAAMETARKRPWAKYGAELSAAIKVFLKGGRS